MWIWNGCGVLVQFSSTQSCNPLSGMHWSTISPVSPNCLPLIMKCGGKPNPFLPPALLNASPLNFPAGPRFGTSFGAGVGIFSSNFVIAAQFLCVVPPAVGDCL